MALSKALNVATAPSLLRGFFLVLFNIAREGGADIDVTHHPMQNG